MSANKIAETSISTGTGNFSLAGAWSVPDSFITGNRTFNSFYGLNHRFPYMIQDKLGNWEKGVGYLSGAAVLVRETVVDNSLSTAALVNFPAGEKLVMVPTDAGSEILPKLRTGGGYAGSGFFFNNGVAHTTVANRLVLIPFLSKRPFLTESVLLNVNTAAASSKARLGIYQITQIDTTHTATLMQDFGEIDTATTGEKQLTASLKLGAGLYFTAFVCNGTPSIRGQGTSFDFAFAGLSSNQAVPVQGFYKTGLTTAVDGLPSSVNFVNGDANANNAAPRILFTGAFL